MTFDVTVTSRPSQMGDNVGDGDETIRKPLTSLPCLALFCLSFSVLIIDQ